jgi:hypothetical protein
VPRDGRTRGCLQQVVLPTASETEADPDVLVTCEAVLTTAKSARRLSAKPIFDVVQRAVRSRPDPSELYTVDHLVEELKGGISFSRFAFDFERANLEIMQTFGARQAPTNDWVMLSPDDSPHVQQVGGSLSGYEPFEESRCEPGAGGRPAVTDDSGLDEVVRGLEQTFIEQSPGKTGGEGTLRRAEDPEIERLRAAVSALSWESKQPSTAAGRRAVLESDLASQRAQLDARRVSPEGATEGMRGVRSQPCRYLGMACYGCARGFALGEMMESCTPGLVHPSASCRELAGQRREETMRAEVERSESTPEFWGVYSDEPGASGVYTSRAQVEHLLDEESRVRWGVEAASFSTHAQAHDFVSSMASERACALSDECVSVDQPLLRASQSVPGYGTKGSTTKAVSIQERLNPNRLGMLRACIEGRCGVQRDGSETECRGGCGRSLHMVQCAQVGKGFAALGNFLCVDCRLTQSNQAPATASAALRRVNEVTMVLEMCQGAESSAAGYADFVQLEERYVLGMGQVLDGRDLIMPRHSKIAFKNFLTWMATDAGRARSLESTFRSAGAFFAKLLEHEFTLGWNEPMMNFTKDPSVKAHLKELLKEVGVEHEPATACTPRMFKLALTKVIPERCQAFFLAAREEVQFCTEGVGGVRIGEVCGGGETHGLLANRVSILTDHETGEVVVEGHLEHSKTGFSRYLDMVGTTKTTGIDVAGCFRRYWVAAGIPTVQIPNQAGVHIERPDFYVVRVSLLGVGDQIGQVPITKLFGFLKSCVHESVQTHLATTRQKGEERAKANGTGSQAKKYINVAGGRGDDASLVKLRDQLTALGFQTSVVPGPLLLASTGGKASRPTLMPLSTSSTFTMTKEILSKAYLMSNSDPNDPDPDLEVDFAAGETPKWTTHSLRRMADTVARRYQETTGVSEADIDLFFGWNERVLLKAMQVHYASMSVRERMKKAKVTCMA